MHGHEKIHEYRTKGRKIASLVFMNDYPCTTDWHIENDHPTVCVAGDEPERLDLRFLVGLSVTVSSPDEQRAKDLHESCIKARAKFVFSAHSCHPIKDTWYAIWSKP